MCAGNAGTMEKEQSKAKPFLPILSVGATAGTIYDIISKSVGFIDLLNEEGTSAFYSLIRPGVLALIALIFSIAYISTAKNTKSQADGENAPGGVALFFTKLANVVVKTCIGLLIVAIIATGVYGALLYKEYSQRPRINICDYVNLEPAIEGYDGQATFDQTKVENTLSYYIKDIFKETNTKNFDNTKDYNEEQDAWSRFYNNLHYELPANASGLSNGDTLTFTVDYQGTDLSQIKADTHVIIEGLGTPKTIQIGTDTAELPYRFTDQYQASAEKSDVIQAAESYMENNFMDNTVTDFVSQSFFCKPKYDNGSSPDALVVVTSYTRYKGESYEKKCYKACYVYPFDSRATADLIGNEDFGGDVVIKFRNDNETTDLEQLEREIRSGSKFDTSTEYELMVIE